MREIYYNQALREALHEEMNRDPCVFVMGEDIGLYGGVFKVTEGLLAAFGPQRVRETPISENGFVGAAVGASMTGMRPVVELMFADFAYVAADSIFNQAAKMRSMSGGRVTVPLVIRTQQGGGRGNGAQHSQSLEAMFAHIPGIKVVLPSTPYDAKGLLKSAIRDENPVVFIEHKLLYSTRGLVPDDEYTLPIGQADIKRPGSDVTIITYSRCVLQALAVATQLAEEGIDVEVLDLRSLVPLDRNSVLASARKTGRVVVVHEAHRFCGVGAEIAALIQEEAWDELHAPVRRVTAKDVPIPVAPSLEQAVLPQEHDIMAAVRCLMSDNKNCS
ncbi:MAG: alpha-ketoacid dehydrogenase subunit beta [Roseiflexaceae bacterium]|nr:alpha-ketoacid dehydrogenase subunit beta [Roseiflexaceae bacterium]